MISLRTRGSVVVAALLLARAVICSGGPEPWHLNDVHSFGQRDPQGGRNPMNPPILGEDGALYGATPIGGAFGKGVVYRFQPGNSSFLVLHHFVGSLDGGSPVGSAFVQASDGRLYGLAVNPRLILYTLATDGSDYRVVFTFPEGAEQGGGLATVSSLTVGPDDRIYGIYVTGGSGGATPHGTIFRLDRDGSGYQELAPLTNPSSPISFGAKKQLFGLTFSTIYRLNPDGSDFATLVDLPPTTFGTAQAEGGLVVASDGLLYGQTDRGGKNGFGTIFRVHEDGTGFEVIFEPTVVTEAGHFRSPAFESDDGFLYGAAGEDGFGTQSFIWRIHKDGTGWQVVHRMLFNGRGTTGVVQAPDGFLYSYTTGGPGGGDLFRMARDGSAFALVHTFPSSEGFPVAPVALVRGVDDSLYGLTDLNGTNGHGTLFRAQADGSGFTILHDFGMGLAAEQGTAPKSLAAGSDGAIYGMVGQQGNAGAGVFRFVPKTGAFTWIQAFASGLTASTATVLMGDDGLLYGAIDTSAIKTERIFRLTPGGSDFTILRTLTSSASIFTGTAALTEGPDGLLYGVTARNGASPVPLLYSLTKDGSQFTSLHDIDVGTNPSVTPPLGLLAAQDGGLYGYSSNVLFRSAKDGTGFQALHTFPSTAFSRCPVEGLDGKIYGALPFGGSATRGAIFRLGADGNGYEEVVSFSNDPLSGQAPIGFLVRASDGAFYGLTQSGGDSNRGTIFRAATGEPSPTATPVASPTPTPTVPPPTPTPTISPTPAPTSSPNPTPSGSPTATPASSATPTPGSSITPTPTATPDETPTPTPPGVTKALNLSTRLLVGPGNNAGIGGFIITGPSSKPVLLRAIGPSLGNLGIANPLADPVLELHGPGAFVAIANNNWRETQEAEITATGIPPTDNLESAILSNLDPGAYTAILTGNGAGSGSALVEVYDLDQSVGSKLANISTRAFAGIGGDIVIAGFILGGGSSDDSIVIRGLGPSLEASGLSPVLTNPTLELRNSDGAVVAVNNDWQDDSAQAAMIIAAGLAPTDSLESAIAATLAPGAYTALLQGIAKSTGFALVEVYDRGP